MSTDVDVEIPIVYLRFKVNTWEKSTTAVFSPTFKFQGREWCLQYYWYSSGYQYLRLINKSAGNYAPFDISLHVESNSTGRIIPELTTKKRIDGKISYIDISEIADVDILRLDPSYIRTNCIKFLVVLKADDILTDMDSKAIQTGCNPHEDMDSKIILTDCKPPQDIDSKAGQNVCNTPEDINVSCSSKLTTLLPSTTPCLHSLSEDLAKLIVQGSDTDVEFQCGGQVIKAHSAIVSARSPPIAKMLASDMIEGRTKVVKIPNMQPEIFDQFLRYLYSGELDELNFEKAISLYEAGQQYAVHALVKRCSDFIINHLSVENACSALFLADAHNDSDFAQLAYDFVGKKYKK